MLKVIDENGNSHEFFLYKYSGQHYDAREYALTVAVIEDTAEAYLVALGDPSIYDGSKRVLIEELHKYLDLLGLPWSKTHTVFKHQYCDFINKNL